MYVWQVCTRTAHKKNVNTTVLKIYHSHDHCLLSKWKHATSVYRLHPCDMKTPLGKGFTLLLILSQWCHSNEDDQRHLVWHGNSLSTSDEWWEFNVQVDINFWHRNVISETSDPDNQSTMLALATKHQTTKRYHTKN